MNIQFENITRYHVSENDIALNINAKLTILVHPDDYNTQSQELLQNILKAMEIAQEDLNLIIIPTLPFFISNHIRKSGLHKMVVFGIQASDLGFNMNARKYHIYTLEDAQLLFSDALEKIRNDKNLKMSLWKQLQIIGAK